MSGKVTHQDFGSLYGPPHGRNRTDTKGKIRCLNGGEWKARCEFSARQLQKFDKSAATPANSQVSCKAHTAQPARELQCEGPCGLWRPLEHFSKRTRTDQVFWCYDCTSWQLSVEPGVAVCAPPNSAAEVDELALLYAKPAEVIVSKEEREERVEQWIQDNPSEAGDYDGIEIATQASVIDTASEVSGPTLLDDNISDLGELPQALNAINLSRIGRYDEPPTTASSNMLVRSGNGNAATESTEFETRSQDSHSKATIIADSVIDTNQQTDYATTNSRTSVNDGSNHDLALVELETTAVVNGPPERQRSPGPSGWARPNQRRIPWAPPKYVLSGSGVDFYHYYYLQQGDEPE